MGLGTFGSLYGFKVDFKIKLHFNFFYKMYSNF